MAEEEVISVQPLSTARLHELIQGYITGTDFPMPLIETRATGLPLPAHLLEERRQALLTGNGGLQELIAAISSGDKALEGVPVLFIVKALKGKFELDTSTTKLGIKDFEDGYSINALKELVKRAKADRANIRAAVSHEPHRPAPQEKEFTNKLAYAAALIAYYDEMGKLDVDDPTSDFHNFKNLYEGSGLIPPGSTAYQFLDLSEGEQEAYITAYLHSQYESDKKKLEALTGLKEKIETF